MMVDGISRPLYLDVADAAVELGISHGAVLSLLDLLGVRRAVCALEGRARNGKCRLTAEHLLAMKRVMTLRNDLQISIPAAVKVLDRADAARDRRLPRGDAR